MNTNDIELLLNKFYEGETSLEEESMLRDFFRTGDVPKSLEHIKLQFNFYIRELEVSSGSELEKRITDGLQERLKAKVFLLNRKFYYAVSAVAASVIIFFGAFNLFYNKPPEVTPENTFKNPEVAYRETAKVLLMLSGKMNEGMAEVGKISKLDAYFNKVFKNR